jgi:hypothetical protein
LNQAAAIKRAAPYLVIAAQAAIQRRGTISG